MRVHSLPRGVHIAPMPKRAELNGDNCRKLQGGDPPQAHRSCTYKWGQGNLQHSARTKSIGPKRTPILWVKLPVGSLLPFSYSY